ncbi:S8 family serine peptidase [Acrocarpospora catenulata]|uniref:S8 family serine peptidase n=1 Tax=Acrocarpospora catenulata TaxID=2836182 RepID=UPI0027E0D583|nr:S8 family serine peptidase [Acrocarpospora catenulata]
MIKRGRATRVLGQSGVAMMVAAVTACSGAGPGTAADGSSREEYLVFYAPGQRDAAATAVTGAGASVEADDPRLGYLVVHAAPAIRLDTVPAVVAVAANRRIGATTRARWESRKEQAVIPNAREAAAVAPEPLASRQWDMKMIGATPTGSYARERGSHKVLVGVIDTGIDGKHPDIAPNFNRALSRNFVIDRPTDSNGKKFDGPCEYKGCKDPADVDDEGHGTHVASTIGSPLNGIGIGGVAPGVSLVNLRAGHDSGFFFLKPTMDALAYAGDTGIDVVNMSFYVDPWTFNCPANPADSPAEQAEQRGILEGMRRAVAYARTRGVTLISAIGNGATDLGHPTADQASPDYPLGAERTRKVDNTCLNVPAELNGVISVSSVGPSGRKSSFSDYGIEQTDVAAPGGDLLDNGTSIKGIRRAILAAAPEHALRAKKMIDKQGRPKDGSVVRDCRRGTCSYYQYLEGTSMAAPHVTGVVALLVARFGKPGRGGLALNPATAERLLYASAKPRPCPTPRAFRYSAGEVQTCEGGAKKNGFFGHGVVNALRAVSLPIDR